MGKAGVQELGGEERGQYIVTNDFSKQLRDVCTELQRAKDHTALEYDIKQLLGYK